VIGKGTQLGQLTLADQRDMPYHITSCSAVKTGAEEEEGFWLLRWPLFGELAGRQSTCEKW